MNADASNFAHQVLGVRLKSEGPRDLNGESVRGKRFTSNDYVEYILPGRFSKELVKLNTRYTFRGIDI